MSKNRNSNCLCILFTLLFLVGCGKSEQSIDVEESISVTAESATTELVNQGNSETVTKEDLYQLAIEAIKDKRYPLAMGTLADVGDFKEAQKLLADLRYLIKGAYIGNGSWIVAALTQSGGITFAYAGENSSQYEAATSWSNLRSICLRGGDSIEALTLDGKILTTNMVTKEELLASPVVSANVMAEVVDAVSEWDSIVDFQTFYPQSAVALTRDGVVYGAYPSYEDGTQKISGWDQIVQVADGRSYVAGLRTDGTVLNKSYGYVGSLETTEWKDIVAISAGSALIGLKEDGTVVSTGINRFGEGDVSSWSDIIGISTSNTTTLGLSRDGTVVAVGDNSYGQRNVEAWTDIVAIAAGAYFSIGLKADGTMVLAGDCSSSGAPTPDVTGLNGLYVPQIHVKDGLTSTCKAEFIYDTKQYAPIKINLPEGWSVNDKITNEIVDDKGNVVGEIWAEDYDANFDLNTQHPNHSITVNDEVVDLPLGKCRVFTIDADNGSAATGLVGTHDAYLASISVEGKGIYVLSFSRGDKGLASKGLFVNVLKSIKMEE